MTTEPFVCAACEGEINEINRENDELKRKVKESRDKYILLLTENLKRDHVLNEINKKMGKTQIANMELKNFEKYENLIGNDGVEKLNSIGDEEKNDSTFILTIIRIIYANEIDILMNTTTTGRDGTSKMSEEKKNVVKILFKERLKNSKDEKTRFEKLNRRLKNAFSNVRRKPKKTKRNEQEENVAADET